MGAMREYEEFKDIEIPKEQEEIMDIMCEAWGKCNESNCGNCKDRPAKYMRIMACTALKYSRLLIERGYRKERHARWEIGYEMWDWGDLTLRCTACGYEIIGNCADVLKHDFKFCPNCGAKMDLE